MTISSLNTLHRVKHGFSALLHPARLSLAQQLVLLTLLPAMVTMLGAITILAHRHALRMTELSRANAQVIVQAQRLRDLREPARMPHLEWAQPDTQRARLRSDSGEILERDPSLGLTVAMAIPGAYESKKSQVTSSLNLAAVANARNEIWIDIATVVAASLLSVMLAGWWAKHMISSPIGRLGAAVDRLGAGQDVRLEIAGSSEVQHLQRGFNQVARTLAKNRRALKSRISEATSELVRKNQQLELASRAKTRLFAAANHDLRQPLHALTLLSDSLANGETDPLRLQRIEYIRECVESLNRQFGELMNLSQLDAGVLKPKWSEFALDRLFDELSRNFRPAAEQQDLRLVVRKTDVWVRCDYVMLSRILSNLVANSLRHTRQGGLLVGARRRGNEIRIDVWDTGIGIAPQHQKRVFQEFYQVNPQSSSHMKQGVGLGLATVQQLAALLDAPVTLTSAPGKGTCVRISVRAAMPIPPEPQAVSPPTQPEEAALCLSGLRVLAVDDEPAILEGLQTALGSRGAQVFTAQTHAEALALADAWSHPPDVVLSDLWLEDGDNGLDLFAALKRHPRGIKADTARLLVTGQTTSDCLREVVKAGVAVLYKPVQPRVLHQAIAAQLAAARGWVRA
jgi:signal transduction histidine kinase/ActR/RegA family two-component response regulator